MANLNTFCIILNPSEVCNGNIFLEPEVEMFFEKALHLCLEMLWQHFKVEKEMRLNVIFCNYMEVLLDILNMYVSGKDVGLCRLVFWWSFSLCSSWLLLALMSIWLYVTLLLWQASKKTKGIQNEEQDAEERDSKKTKVSTCTGKEFLNYKLCSLGRDRWV